MTTTTLQYRAVPQKAVALQMIKVNWKLIYLVALLCAAVMLVFYVLRVNELTRGAYLIKNYNKEIKSLAQENRALEANFAENDFLGQAMERAKAMDFQKTA